MRTKWDERYGGAEYAFGTEPNDFLRDEAGRIPSGGDVLCLADGEGRNGVYLAEQGYTVCSVDLSKVGLEKANRLADQRGAAERDDRLLRRGTVAGSASGLPAEPGLP